MAKESFAASVGEIGVVASNKVVDIATRVAPFADDESFLRGAATVAFVALLGGVFAMTPKFEQWRREDEVKNNNQEGSNGKNRR